MRIAGWLVLGIVGCGDAEDDPLQLAKRARTVCPHVAVDQLAGDWVQVVGAAATGEVRARIEARGDGYVAWHVDHLDRQEWVGTREERAVRFTSGDRAWRLVPSLETCSLLVTPLGPDGEAAGDPVEWLELPDIGVTFAYAPATEALQIDGDPTALPAGDVTGWVDDPDALDACDRTVVAWLDGVQIAREPARIDTVDATRRWSRTWRGLAPGEHLLELSRLAACMPDATPTDLGTAGARVTVTALH